MELTTTRSFKPYSELRALEKLFTVANVINEINRPTLVLAHNKTLAAQLYSEFKQFFQEFCKIFCFLL